MRRSQRFDALRGFDCYLTMASTSLKDGSSGKLFAFKTILDQYHSLLYPGQRKPIFVDYLFIFYNAGRNPGNGQSQIIPIIFKNIVNNLFSPAGRLQTVFILA